MKIKVDERFLTGSMYAPFPRTLCAPMEEWDRDMQNMAKLGYTCLHGFAEWHDIEYEKGRFDFTKIDHFLSCANKNGLVAIINVATQNSVGFYSPRWLMEEYRGVGTGVVDSQGQVLSQEEYVVPCLDDPVYNSYARRYLKEVAKNFAGDDRVGAFVLWGEPVLSSIRPNGLNVCYCKYTKEKFRKWLKEKYGDIDKLNQAWGSEGPSDYVAFTQVNPPTDLSRQKGGFNSWEDWSEYMEFNLADHIAQADRIFKENGALQPTITEMLPGINNSVDPWKLAQGTDIVGVSLFGKPTRNTALCMNMSNSMAKANNKSVFVIEAGGGSIKFDEPCNPSSAIGFTPSVEELKTTLLMRANYGAKGVMFWCWRPRLSDIEGNDFGMCRSDGKPLKRTIKLGEFAKKMEEKSSVYNRCERNSSVAIFTSRQINHIMRGDKMSNNYLNAITGANHMLTDLHINSDFVSEKQVIRGDLNKYKVLILACAYVISEECEKAIEKFVSEGGYVIADYILAEKRLGGRCYTSLPGAGFDKLFGIEREDVLAIAHPTMERKNPLGIETGCMIEQIILNEAKSICGEYMPEYPLMSENQYGKGKAIYICTQFFSRYAVRPKREVRQVLEKLLIDMDVKPYIKLVNEDLKEQSALITSQMASEDGKTRITTVSNLDYEIVQDDMILPDGDYKMIEEQDKYVITKENGKVRLHFTLNALESLAIYTKD